MAASMLNVSVTKITYWMLHTQRLQEPEYVLISVHVITSTKVLYHYIEGKGKDHCLKASYRSTFQLDVLSK